MKRITVLSLVIFAVVGFGACAFDSSNPTGSVSDLPSHPDNSIANETSQEINHSADDLSISEFKSQQIEMPVLDTDTVLSLEIKVPETWYYQDNKFYNEAGYEVAGVYYAEQVEDPQDPFKNEYFFPDLELRQLKIGDADALLSIAISRKPDNLDLPEEKQERVYAYSIIQEDYILNVSFFVPGVADPDTEIFYQDMMQSIKLV